MKVGYRRVSTEDQNLDRQELGEVERTFEEKISGKDTEREALQEMIAFVRDGDEVLVHSIDRLARALRDLQNIIQKLNDKGVSISFLSERLSFSANTSDPFAKLQLQIIGSVAEFERNIIRKRQAEGIAKAKAKGVYKGRKKTIDDRRIYELSDIGMSQNQIANEMGITRISVYRYLKERKRVA